MPIYEYRCQNCQSKFDLRRPIAEANALAPCPKCQSPNTKRALSLFAAHVRGNDGSAHAAAGGGGCAGCSAASCAGCKH